MKNNWRPLVARSLLSRMQEALRMKRVRPALIPGFVCMISAVCFVTPQPGAAQATSSAAPEVTVQHDVPMKTRDGVTLYADIYRPNFPDKFPVILMRTPYDKSVGWAVVPAAQIVRRGYVVVIQDVRGRYTSEGEWYPFRHEQADGYDTV